MAKFGLIEGNSKIESYDIYYEELISRNKEITIVFPTATLNLANNDIIFDIANTPSYLMGSFSEYLRRKKDSLRSLHALWSVSAIGPNSRFLLSNLTNNPYDESSVFAKILNDPNAFFLSLGQHPRFMLSIVHHIEYISNVNYRFNKQFKKKYIGYDGNINEKNFELFVLKKEYIKLKRTKNNLIFKNYEMKGQLNKYNMNQSEVYLFNLREFYDITKDLFKKQHDCYWY